LAPPGRFGHYRVLQNGTILVAGVSVEHPMCPMPRDTVRASLACTGFVIEPLNARACRVKYIIVVDPVLSNIPQRMVVRLAGLRLAC
jgi:hypothetical protein